jgi:hypothetical protein
MSKIRIKHFDPIKKSYTLIEFLAVVEHEGIYCKKCTSR